MEDDEMFEKAAVFYSSCPILHTDIEEGEYDAELERLQALLIDVHNSAIAEAIEVVQHDLLKDVVANLKLRTRQ